MLLLKKKYKPRCEDTINEEKIDRNDKTEYWPTIIKESLNWLPFYISWSSMNTGYIMIIFFTVIIKGVFNI